MKQPVYLRIKVPASTANLGPGYDTLGLALKIYNYFEFTRLPGKTVQIVVRGEQRQGIPETKQNLVYRAMKRGFNVCQQKFTGMRIQMHINVPLARGLGSSATAIIAGMTAANHFCARKLGEEELLREIIRMEGHPDNVTASVFGGLTAVTMVDNNRLLYKCYKPYYKLKAVLVIPNYELATTEARRLLPSKIPHQDAVFNLSRMPFIIDRLTSGQLADLHWLMQDRLHEPYRRHLIKGYEKIIEAGQAAGAGAVVLSGAGPAMVAFCIENENEIATAMNEALLQLKIANHTIILSPCPRGTVIEKIE